MKRIQPKQIVQTPRMCCFTQEKEYEKKKGKDTNFLSIGRMIQGKHKIDYQILVIKV